MSSLHHKIRVIGGDFMLPRDAACVLLDVNDNTIVRWLKSDDPPPYDPISKGFPAKALGHWIRKNQTVRKSKGKGAGSYPWLPDGVVMVSPGGLPASIPTVRSYDEERTRKEAAAADKLEMENEVTRGALVRVSDVEQTWSSILSRVKTRIMQIPYSCAMLVAGDTEITSVQSKISDAVREALEELSNDE